MKIIQKKTYSSFIQLLVLLFNKNLVVQVNLLSYK